MRTLAWFVVAIAGIETVAWGQSCSYSHLGGGVTGTVMALESRDVGGTPTLYVGGELTQAGTVTVSNVASWNGASWSGLGSGVTDPSGTARVRTLASFDDGNGPRLFVGGRFSVAGGIPVTGIAAWDGQAWSAVGTPLTNGAQPVEVLDLVVHDDGSGPALYVAGEFIGVTGMLTTGILRWNGIAWSMVGSGLPTAFGPGWATALAVHDAGNGPELYAGGQFILNTSRVARWDGAAWSGVGTGIHNVHTSHEIHVLTSFDEGNGPRLFVGGKFWAANFGQVNNIARFDNGEWTLVGSSGGTTLSPNAGVFSTTEVAQVFAFHTYHDGSAAPRLYVGGQFALAGGVTTSGLAAWDGAGFETVGGGVFHPNLTRQVQAMTVFPHNGAPALVIGGQFTMAGAANASGLAIWNCQSTPHLAATQPQGPGTAVRIANANLIPGRTYFNVFSVDLCPQGPGTGPFGGLCVATPAGIQFVQAQLLAPLGTGFLHFVAPEPTVAWPPTSIPPLAVEGVCVEVATGLVSPVSAIAVQ